MYQQNVKIFSLFFFQQFGRVFLEDVLKNSLVEDKHMDNRTKR